MEARDLTIESITLGETVILEKLIDENHVKDFARISGDYNPLHMDEEFAQRTSFGRRVAHGFSFAILMSQVVGMYVPGKRCLLLEESTRFRKPVFIGDTIKVVAKVIQSSKGTGIVKIAIEFYVGDVMVAEGNVVTQVM